MAFAGWLPAANGHSRDSDAGHGWLGPRLRDQGELAAAQPLRERALAGRERVLGPDHPHTATSLNNLAAVLQNQSELATARPLFGRPLAIRERVLGSDHLDTAQSLDNLAALLHAQGESKTAHPLFERALVISERMLGPDNPLGCHRVLESPSQVRGGHGPADRPRPHSCGYLRLHP